MIFLDERGAKLSLWFDAPCDAPSIQGWSFPLVTAVCHQYRCLPKCSLFARIVTMRFALH